MRKAKERNNNDERKVVISVTGMAKIYIGSNAKRRTR